MAKNGIDDLRDHLFSELERLSDLEKPVDIDRSKAICEVAGKIIESAKAEVLMVEALCAKETKSALWREKPALGMFKAPEQIGAPA